MTDSLSLSPWPIKLYSLEIDMKNDISLLLRTHARSLARERTRSLSLSSQMRAEREREREREREISVDYSLKKRKSPRLVMD